MRCSRLLHAAKPASDGVFGKFELLRPPKIRKSAASSGASTSVHVPPLSVPRHILRPSYVPVNLFTRKTNDEPLMDGPPDELEGYHGEPGVGNSQTGVIPLGGKEERGVRYSGSLVAEVLDQVKSFVQPGITTSAIDRRIHELIVSKNAYPSPLGYQGFTKSVTTSVNNVICHGIPDDRPLHPTDIVNIDVTIFAFLPTQPGLEDAPYRIAFHGDSSITICLPEVDEQGRELVEITQEALDVGIKQCGPGRKFREIGCAIE
ncbi:hypothetical protein QFC22_000646 [Naganishia vaughanmartiniae]|uniref:Uncharacterized protein n=1 Tax=Naganishia vaughanmartiniae TaxID=1424756 RepID=A0ACC2XQM8_9TREE|nr:hypothetical protein QFC22_000646 [Naganishia vaughanmartiniae]